MCRGLPFCLLRALFRCGDHCVFPALFSFVFRGRLRPFVRPPNSVPRFPTLSPHCIHASSFLFAFIPHNVHARSCPYRFCSFAPFGCETSVSCFGSKRLAPPFVISVFVRPNTWRFFFLFFVAVLAFGIVSPSVRHSSRLVSPPYLFSPMLRHLTALGPLWPTPPFSIRTPSPSPPFVLPIYVSSFTIPLRPTERARQPLSPHLAISRRVFWVFVLLFLVIAFLFCLWCYS